MGDTDDAGRGMREGDREREAARFHHAPQEGPQRSLERERASREHLERLQTLTAALAGALGVEDATAEIVAHAPPVFRATRVIVVLDYDEATLHLASETSEPVAGLRGLPAGGSAQFATGVLAVSEDQPVTEVLASGDPVFLASPEELLEQYPNLRDTAEGTSEFVAGVFPLAAGTGEEAIGALAIVLPYGEELTEEARIAGSIVASLCAQALARARLHDRDHRFAETLQHALLPDRFPDIPAVRFAARYLPAAERLAVGGDWYDVIALNADRVGVVVGDVAGHGRGAATVMGQMRNAVRALATTIASPAGVLGAFNRFVCAQLPEDMATLVYLVLEPASGKLVWANAGHLPPLLLAGAGLAPTYLTEALEPPVGVSPSARYGEATRRLEGTCCLLAYTDGLIERRTEAIDVGLQRLVDACADNGTDPDVLCGQVLRALVGGGRPTDDAAVLVASITAGASDGSAQAQSAASAT